MVAEITGRTRVWVHLAHPSAHVRAPERFNIAFARRGVDAVAVSIDVAPADLRALVQGLRGWRNLVGIGVTMPHKEAIAHELDELDGVARAIHTVNAVRREPDGRLVGANTDGSGFVAGLRRNGHEPRGRAALVIGAGGAGAAIAFALAEAGVSRLGIANRSAAKARTVAERVAAGFPGVSVSVADPDPAGYSLVVNATSLGMQLRDPLPLDPEQLAPGTLVAEVIMSPPRTALLDAAERRGGVAHPGLPMLECQIDEVLDFLGLPAST